MPVVSINLSDGAYAVYKDAMKHREGSQMVSRAVMFYAARPYGQDEPIDRMTIEPGDIRISPLWGKLVWVKKTKSTGEPGWEPAEGEIDG